MTVTLRSPATIFELADLSGSMSRVHWAVAKEMWRTGTTFAFREGDQLLALAGLSPIPRTDGAELWFCPSRPSPRQVLAMVRLARLTLPTVPYRGIVTICRSEAGKRLARALGFSPAGSSDLGELWRHVGNTGRGNGEEAAAADGRNPGRQPAAEPGADGARAGTARPVGGL